MEIINEEIKFKVNKEMEEDEIYHIKHKEIKKPQFENYKPINKYEEKYKLNSADNKEKKSLLDKKTLKKIETAYNGNERNIHTSISNKDIVDEILNEGRDEFLCISKRGTYTSQTPRTITSSPIIRSNQWRSHRKHCAVLERIRFLSPDKEYALFKLLSQRMRKSKLCSAQNQHRSSIRKKIDAINNFQPSNS